MYTGLYVNYISVNLGKNYILKAKNPSYNLTQVPIPFLSEVQILIEVPSCKSQPSVPGREGQAFVHRTVHSAWSEGIRTQRWTFRWHEGAQRYVDAQRETALSLKVRTTLSGLKALRESKVKALV